MAHGSPRLNICNNCRRYKLVERFSNDPICPKCGKKSEQIIDKDLVKKRHKLPPDYQFHSNFNSWTKF